MPQLYVQRDQPAGVPPLSLTGERTLPGRPRGELLVPAPPRGLRVDRGARARPPRGRPRLRRGLRLGGARAHGGLGGRGRRQPGGVRARAPEVHERAVAVRAQHDRAVDRRRRLRRLPADDRARAGPRRRARPHPRADRAARRRLRLDAERAHAGARRAPSARATRGTCASTARPSIGALCGRHFGSVDLLGLFHARKLRAHQWALEHAGWDAVHARLGITGPFYDRFTPAISTRDFALRRSRLDRALDFLAVLRP